MDGPVYRMFNSVSSISEPKWFHYYLLKKAVLMFVLKAGTLSAMKYFCSPPV